MQIRTYITPAVEHEKSGLPRIARYPKRIHEIRSILNNNYQKTMIKYKSYCVELVIGIHARGHT